MVGQNQVKSEQGLSNGAAAIDFVHWAVENYSLFGDFALSTFQVICISWG